MAVQRLNLTRDQLASFLQDFEQIKQFERLFATVDTINTVTLDEINVSAGSAFAAANEALAQISALSSQTDFLAFAPPDLGGTVTSVGLSGGTTGITIATSTTNPITTSGTFTLGGTLVAVNGGTGLSSYAVGDILFASTTTALSRLADVATGNALISGGVGVAPSYGKIGLTTHVSGTLPVANGGTGQTSYTNGQLLIGNSTGNTLTKATLTAGTNISITDGAGSITINATDAFSGTVTTVSVVSANGFAGTVANATTTPAITLTTTVTGVLKGNGTAISAATKDVDYFAPSPPVTQTADFTVGVNENWVINNKTGSTCTVTLPAAASYSGRCITFQNYQDQSLVSASSNVVPRAGGAAGTAILDAVSGNWATLVSNGTNWVIMQAAAFNNLLF
jgi:hypothetical protein